MFTVAANDVATTVKNIAVTISVLTNDSDLDGAGLTVTSVTQGGGVPFLDENAPADRDSSLVRLLQSPRMAAP